LISMTFSQKIAPLGRLEDEVRWYSWQPAIQQNVYRVKSAVRFISPHSTARYNLSVKRAVGFVYAPAATGCYNPLSFVQFTPFLLDYICYVHSPDYDRY
jgi:hypothetical protein